jgi:ABC-type transporter Mla subunit MlaD
MAMEIGQLKQQLTQLDQIINRAAQAIKEDKGVPKELKDCVHELGSQSKQAQQTLKDAQDAETLMQCIDDLKETSDRANRACENARNVGAQTKAAIHLAQQQLSELKDQLH